MSLLSYGEASIEDLPQIVEMKLAMFEEAGFSHLLASDAAPVVLSEVISAIAQPAIGTAWRSHFSGQGRVRVQV
jgi:hypothetical protein